MTDGLISKRSATERMIIAKTLLESILQDMPTVVPRKGKWEEKQDSDWAGGGAWVCSECGFGYAFGAYHEAYEFNYCPNCGARMEESE